jgi:hypothetical protein
MVLGTSIGLLPFLFHLRGPLMPGLGEYARRWRHNESLFWPIEAGARAAVGEEPRELGPTLSRLLSGREDTKVYPDEAAGALARAVAAALWLIVAVVAIRRRLDIRRGGLVLTTAALLLSPVVHPWYATWLLPFLTLVPYAPLLLFAALAPLGDLALGPIWPRLVEYGLPGLLAGFLGLRRVLARPGARG